MFGGHIWELAIVLIIALVVFGPKRLPEIGGAVGKGIREFKRGTQDLEERVTHHEDPAPGTPSQLSATPSPEVKSAATPERETH